MTGIKKARPKKRQKTSDYNPIRAASARLRVSGGKRNTAKVAQRSNTNPTPRMALVEILPPNRQEMIALAAYYRAEKRAFIPGGEIEDWLEAEKEIDRLNRLA